MRTHKCITNITSKFKKIELDVRERGVKEKISLMYKSPLTAIILSAIVYRLGFTGDVAKRGIVTRSVDGL